ITIDHVWANMNEAERAAFLQKNRPPPPLVPTPKLISDTVLQHWNRASATERQSLIKWLQESHFMPTPAPDRRSLAETYRDAPKQERAALPAAVITEYVKKVIPIPVAAQQPAAAQPVMPTPHRLSDPANYRKPAPPMTGDVIRKSDLAR